jgi:hypothetical protein
MRFVVPTCAMALLLLGGCSSGDATSECAGDPDCIGAGGAGSDAGAFSAADASPPPAQDDGGIDSPGRVEDVSAGNCLNGIDDDLDGILDCGEPACATTGICCVGSTDPGCCQGAAPLVDARLSTCRAGDYGCLGVEVSAFGGGLPRVEGGGLVPGGDRRDDGLVVGPALDLTRDRVELSARVAAAEAFDCGDGCLDAVAFGIGPAPHDGALRLEPSVAVVVHASRGELSVLWAGEVMQRWILEPGTVADYRIVREPTGGVEVWIDDRPVFVAEAPGPPLPPGSQHLLLYGRSQNRPGDAPLPSRILEIGLRTWRCDMPAALSDPPGSSPGPQSIDVAALGPGPVAAAAEGDAVRLVAADDGAIVTALWDPETGGLRAAPRPLLSTDGVRYADPSLVRMPGGALLLLATRFAEAGGPPDAVAAHLRDDRAQEPFVLDLPGEGPAPRELDGLLYGDALYLLGRGEVQGRFGLWLFRGPWNAVGPFERVGQEPLLAPRREAMAAFDRDEVAEPTLLLDGRGVLRVHYAGRRGSRWSVGLLVGERPEQLVRYGDAPLLTATGAGVDALGARGPAAVIVEDRLQLFYTGLDGVRARLTRREGGAP